MTLVLVTLTVVVCFGDVVTALLRLFVLDFSDVGIAVVILEPTPLLIVNMLVLDVVVMRSHPLHVLAH